MTTEERRAKLKAVKEKKKAANETMAEAWERIYSLKLSDKDREKLDEVKAAMDAGEIERDPADMYSKRGTYKKFSKAEALRMWRVLMDSQRERKIKELVANTPDNYRLITTEQQMVSLVKALKNEPIIAVDTETTGLDVYEDVIVGLSFTLPTLDAHVYIPVAHQTKEAQLPRTFVLEMLRDVLESEEVGKVLHNARFDAHMFLRHGVDLRGIAWDTQIAQHLLNENETSYRLKDLATRWLNEPSDTFDTLFGKDCRFDTISLDVALAYAAKDTDITWRLYEFQQEHFKRFPKLKTLYEKVDNPLIRVVIDMERAGFVLDTSFAAEYGRKLSDEINTLEQSLKEHFGEINVNSNVQLSKVLYDDLKLGRKLPFGAKKNTEAKTLKMLAKHHPGVDALLQYRDKTKLYGTYVEALPKQIKRDGRIHGSFLQASTVTGRFSSRNPNLQNQPKAARKMFIAPEGQVILSADFSQQEPRLLAHFTGEPVLVEAYRQGKDLYQTAAAEMFNLPLEECAGNALPRKKMKMGILAVMYGTGPKTLADQLGIDVKEAEEFIETFYRKYTKVKAWIDGNIEFARKNGYVEMLGGRKRRLTDIKSADRWERLRAERQCTNAIIQGSAAIQTKVVMIKLHELCLRKGWTLAATIHDEVLLYVPQTITPEEIYEIEDVMVNTVKLAVPSKTDIEAGIRWGESVEFDRAKGGWTRDLEKDGQEVNLGIHTDLGYAIKRMYDGINAGWLLKN